MEAVRREGDRVVPAGPKARRTRAQLIAAATALFAEQGFQNSAVAQIAERAGVSLGTFYQYFRNRDEVLAAMVSHQIDAIRADQDRQGWRVGGGLEALERVLLIYIEGYTRAIDLSRVWESVSQTEPAMIELRREAGRRSTEPLARELVRAGKAGLMAPMSKREAQLTARALAGMIDRMCFDVFILDPPDPPATQQEIAALVARLWAGALGLADA